MRRKLPGPPRRQKILKSRISQKRLKTAKQKKKDREREKRKLEKQLPIRKRYLPKPPIRKPVVWNWTNSYPFNHGYASALMHIWTFFDEASEQLTSNKMMSKKDMEFVMTFIQTALDNMETMKRAKGSSLIISVTTNNKVRDMFDNRSDADRDKDLIYADDDDEDDVYERKQVSGEKPMRRRDILRMPLFDNGK